MLLVVMIIGALTLSCDYSPIAETEEMVEVSDENPGTRAVGICSGCGLNVVLPCSICGTDLSRCALHNVKNCGFCSNDDGTHVVRKKPFDPILTWPALSFDPELLFDFTFYIKFWYPDAPALVTPYYSGDLMYHNPITVDSNKGGGYYYLYIYYDYWWTLTRGTFPEGVSFASVDNDTGALNYTTTSFSPNKWHTFLLKVGDNSTGERIFGVKLTSYNSRVQKYIRFDLDFRNPQNLFGRIVVDPDPTGPIGGGTTPIGRGEIDPGNP